jgi:hypothetical protein
MGMAYGDPGAGVRDPSEFTCSPTNWGFESGDVAIPKINGAVEDARMLPPLRNGLVLLSISVSAPSWIRRVPTEE